MKGIALILVVILVLVVALVPITAIAAPPLILVDYRPVEISPEIRGWEASPEHSDAPPADLAAAAAAAAAEAAELYDCIDPSIEPKLWRELDTLDGEHKFAFFHLIAESDSAEVWVQTDLGWPEGDERDTPVVTCDQADYVLSEFDNNIYPVETDFFDEPNLHNGINSRLAELGIVGSDYYSNTNGRQVILVSNIKDDNYYDPAYPDYIGGFYAPSYQVDFDRNVISIDAYDWENRLGPSGSHPHLVEAVVAHEYQYLLHDDYDPDEEALVKEGLAMFAEYLTGYATGDEQYSAFLQRPENSLVVRGDQGEGEIMADYGLVYLFQIYLWEKFGPEFIQAEFMSPENGVASINSTLDAFGSSRDFADIYHDFSVAVLIDSKHGDYRYGFENLDLNIDIGTPGQPNPEAYDTPGAPPWGTDYIWIKDTKELSKITFNGLDYSIFPSGWSSDGDVLWSGTGDLLDVWGVFEAEATDGSELTFDAFWDLETSYDFGFVQVSMDGGYTWASLEGDQTSYEVGDDAHPKVVENLPGLTGWSNESNEWTNLSYDLSAYSGDILIGFRLVTDWTIQGDGWSVDNIKVDDTLISDGSDAVIFQDITEVVPINNNFTVTFVGHLNKGQGNQVKVLTMCLDEVTEEGMLELRSILKGSKTAVMLISFDAPDGFDNYVEYSYELVPWGNGPKKPK